MGRGIAVVGPKIPRDTTKTIKTVSKLDCFENVIFSPSAQIESK